MLTALLITVASATTQPADIVINNARIWSDGLVSFAESAAVRDGRFVHVGAPIDDLVGPGTNVIDAAGRVVIPGLIDSHVHMLGGGSGLMQLQLRDARDKSDFIQRVADWTADLEPGQWVRGGRWSTESWRRPEQPVKEWIDAVTGDHPVYLPRMDGHSVLVNSAALRQAGITNDTPPDPAGGIIDRDPQTGEPTGILRESAMGIVAGFIPEPSPDERLAALRRAMKEANRHGVTGVADIPDVGDLPVYEALARGSMSVRFILYPTARDWADAAGRVASFRGRRGWVEIRGLKTYLDGSLGSRTAYMHDPFHGNEPAREDWRGLLREDALGNRLRDNLAAAHGAGLQTIAHAIGDEANHVLLDTLEEVYGEDLLAARCRSEHTQHLRPEDVARFGRLGVIASMQPLHKADDGRYAEAYLGDDRCKSSYTYKSLLDTGAIVVFGSDWPVVSINPFLGVEAAVTGRTLDGVPWQIQENITIAEALRCYTSRAAWGSFFEQEVGRIAPGLRADFVILDRSPFDEGVDWAAVAPAAVYVEGKLVYAP
jgi:predicted amidohydrolase YtcJ